MIKKQKKKRKKMIEESLEYVAAKMSLALSFAPDIRPCTVCGYPRAEGYVCFRCRNGG